MRYWFLSSVQKGEEASNPDLSTASYDNVSLDVSAQDGNPSGVAFSSDDTKMYMLGFATGTVFQYTLTTTEDLSTASYDNVSFGVSGQENQARDVTFSSDGTKMYVTGNAEDDVNQYALNTAWDLSTASFTKKFSVASQIVQAVEATFSSDGTKMYAMGFDADTIYQYTLTTAWDVGTASYDNVSLGVGAQETDPRGIALSFDDTKLYIIGFGGDAAYQYTLSTAGDLSTASYDNVSFGVGTQDDFMVDLTFSSSGAKMYTVGDGNNSIYQYSV